jgi:hypothetical protein
VRPRYSHHGTAAKFLGRFQGFDLYCQSGYLFARFSGEPVDYLIGVRKCQRDNVPALAEARRRAERRGLELDTSQEPVARRLSTSGLVAHASREASVVRCFRFERTYRRDHEVRVFRDGRVEEVGTQHESWHTTVGAFLRKYPDGLGLIWHLGPDAHAGSGGR